MKFEVLWDSFSISGNSYLVYQMKMHLYERWSRKIRRGIEANKNVILKNSKQKSVQKLKPGGGGGVNVEPT